MIVPPTSSMSSLSLLPFGNPSDVPATDLISPVGIRSLVTGVKLSGIQSQFMVQDRAVAFEIEIRMVGQVDDRVPVGCRAVLDARVRLSDNR